MKVERFSYKLAGMKKPDSFIVYPRKAGQGYYIAQGERSIVSVNPDTGIGMLNWNGNNPKYFVHLSALAGAHWVTLPREFVNLVINYAPASGDLIGASPITGPVYLA